jgi:hypothetical protein
MPDVQIRKQSPAVRTQPAAGRSNQNVSNSAPEPDCWPRSEPTRHNLFIGSGTRTIAPDAGDLSLFSENDCAAWPSVRTCQATPPRLPVSMPRLPQTLTHPVRHTQIAGWKNACGSPMKKCHLFLNSARLRAGQLLKRPMAGTGDTAIKW